MRTLLPLHTANGAFLPEPWVIEEAERRERERQEQERPYLELPLGTPDVWSEPSPRGEDEPQRGVVIISL